MSLSLRIFIVYIIFVSLCSYFIFRTVMEEIRPGVRQSTEETLIDTANLLAEFLREPMLDNRLTQTSYADILRAYGQRQPNAKIWGFAKHEVNHRIYVTDKNGIVVLDSQNIAVGQDYSRWNDVHLTLRGKYGARSSREVDGDAQSTIMYVAAPIKNGEEIIGAVSVAKPNRSVQPFIDRTERRLGFLGGGLILLGLIAGGSFSWWLSRELRRLREYALNVSQGNRAVLPESKIASGELRQLAQALESMRTELDGKAYVEHYVQTLTHELKSPLAGIRAAAELLQSPMNEAQRQRFIQNIDTESYRLQQLIERLLNLARVEQQQELQDPTPIMVRDLWEQLLEAQSARITQQKLLVSNDIDHSAIVIGESFLVRQAFANLLDNALDFTPAEGKLQLSTKLNDNKLTVALINEGEAIPEFAISRLTERFYSLPRPITGKKSTGLGLNFVQEVMSLHKGQLQVRNTANGVEVAVSFPAVA